MSNARRVAVVAGPLMFVVGAVFFGIELLGRDRSDHANWLAAASFVVAVIALVVTWLTWVHPMSPGESASRPAAAGHRPEVNKVKGKNSFGSAYDSQIVYGDDNRLGEGKSGDR